MEWLYREYSQIDSISYEENVLQNDNDYRTTAEVQKVVMIDEEKPKESTPEGGKPSKDAPKTGDNTNLLLWLIVLGMSLSGVVVLGRKIKKK